MIKLRNILDEISGKDVSAIKSLGKPILVALRKELNTDPVIVNNNIDSTFSIDKDGYMSVDMKDGKHVQISTKNDLPNKLVAKQANKSFFKPPIETIFYYKVT